MMIICMPAAAAAATAAVAAAAAAAAAVAAAAAAAAGTELLQIMGSVTLGLLCLTCDVKGADGEFCKRSRSGAVISLYHVSLYCRKEKMMIICMPAAEAAAAAAVAAAATGTELLQIMGSVLCA